jgi:hypothetical protein
LKKRLSLFFLFLYLTSFTEFKEFFKLPLLVEHYFEHQESNKYLTLITFLALHYNEDNSKFPDFQKDMKLPFKSHENCVSNVIGGYVPQSIFFIDFNLNQFIENVSPSIFKELIYSSYFLSSIWQPPKF